jgi:hypothetical protein
MNVNLLGRTPSYAGMNVDMLAGSRRFGEARAEDAASDHLADNINDMLS